MFKKILTAVFALTLTFILASCSTEDSISDSGADSSAMSDGGAIPLNTQALILARLR
jgi:hypothetical protein